MKKILSIFIAATMLTFISSASAKSTYTDINGHWASSQIETWSDYGVISGYDGQFSPDRSITRGEFAVVLNQLMAYQESSENRFADLGENFYTDSVLKLNKAGVMQGYDNKISPTASLTREEAAVMISRALGIDAQDKANKSFSDDIDVSSWARPNLNAMINLGLINGADGKLNPKNTITRAEVVTILDNAVLPVLKSGEVKDLDVTKIFVISVGDVTITNAKIDSKIIISQGVKEGKVTFVNSKINASVTVDNDRTEFIVLENTTVSDESILANDAFVPQQKEEEKPDDKEPSGGGSGSGGGGSSGGKDDKEEEDKSKEYKELNKEMIANLKTVSEDIAFYLDPNDADHYSIFTNEEKYILRKIKGCIDETITYEEKTKIDAAFIKTTYNVEIEEVKVVYDQMEAEGKEGEFHSKLFVNLNSYTLIWLADTLGIDLSEYGIDISNYLQ